MSGVFGLKYIGCLIYLSARPKLQSLHHGNYYFYLFIYLFI